MRFTSVSNHDNVIDSRDVIARISELESEIEGYDVCDENGATEQFDGDGNAMVSLKTCETCNKTWNDALLTGGTPPAPGDLCPYEAVHSEIEELEMLEALQDGASGCGVDWEYGVTLIRDSYFKDYARELADEMGVSSWKESWPLNCIDWEEATDQLQQDYSTVSFDGVEYWVR